MSTHWPAAHQRQQRGLAAVEFALIAPALLMLLFAVIDIGRVILVRQVMLNLSREAANLACRGTAFSDVLTAAQTSSAPLNLTANGYIILTEAYRSSASIVTIKQQQHTGGHVVASHFGSGIGTKISLPSTPTAIPSIGLSLFIAEVYYHSPPITPLGHLVNLVTTDAFYDVAFF